MSKKRIYELAKELGLESKAVLERARELGMEVKTASSGLDEESEKLVRLAFDDASAGAEPAPPAVATVPAVETAPPPAAEPTPPAPEPTPDAAPVAEEAPVPAPTDDDDSTLMVEPGITVQEFGRLIDQRTGDVSRTLMGMGEMIPGGGEIPEHALEALGREFGYEVLVVQGEPKEEIPEYKRNRSMVDFEDAPSSLKGRPPVVTVMGHVDHGKTKLLDTIRLANVAAGEAGGITQHIGAYQIDRGGQKITFIDTPGHEAFTALRARGADITDIVILVVAADDGVMPQTAEAIAHTKAAGVPMIVAINKIDLPGANPATVRGALTQHEIVVEELGGDVVSAEISALTGEGVDDLLEMVSLIAEVEDLKANPSAPAVGTVIESGLEVGRGPVATVIVQRGTLKKGDAIVAGAASGRVRAMFDDEGNAVNAAGPSMPVVVMGWSDVPSAGDMFQVVKNERKARSLADQRIADLRASELTVPTATERLGQLLEDLRTADHSELRVIVKADAHGSLEAIRESLAKISREDAYVTLILGGVGGITENDVRLAETADAIIYGFNARPDTNARKAAKESAIDIRTFGIIYELLDDIEGLLVGQLSPEEVERFLGVAEVRAVFRAPRYGFVAGSYVTEGEINRNARARLVRDGVVIHDGRIASLRRFKEDVGSVATGFECGIGLENFKDIKEGDTIESYEVREVART